jgi:rSAM/selenodomain-associated transferase 1
VTPQLYIMVKEPHPGRVKTRLGCGIGHVKAAWWFRHQSQKLVRRMANDPRWQTILAVSPDVEGVESRVWPVNVTRHRQGGGDLGDRMGRIFRKAAPGPVMIVGADIPDIRRHHIARAFAMLGSNDAVIGPTPDGGYWLFGLKNSRAVSPAMFVGVRWSTPFALTDTLATIAKLKVAKTVELHDIDTAQDLLVR